MLHIINKDASKEIWKNNNKIKCYFSSPSDYKVTVPIIDGKIKNLLKLVWIFLFLALLAIFISSFIKKLYHCLNNGVNAAVRVLTCNSLTAEAESFVLDTCLSSVPFESTNHLWKIFFLHFLLGLAIAKNNSSEKNVLKHPTHVWMYDSNYSQNITV